MDTFLLNDKRHNFYLFFIILAFEWLLSLPFLNGGGLSFNEEGVSRKNQKEFKANFYSLNLQGRP